MPEPVIRARGLSKRYGKVKAVDRIDVEVERGDLWGLVGPKGACKARPMVTGIPSDNALLHLAVLAAHTAGTLSLAIHLLNKRMTA